MTLVQVIDAARGLLGAETLDSSRTAVNDNSFWTDSLLITYTNLVQEEVQNEIIQSFEDYFVTQTTLSVVNGVAEYTLPTGFIKMRRVEDMRNTSSPVEIMPVSLNQRGSNPAFFAIPSATYWGGGYYILGNQIILGDTPTFTDASAIRLHYVKRLSDMTALSATSEIPSEHHRVLVWGVVKYALFQQQSDTTLANQEYASHLARLKMQVEDRQVQKSRRVVRTYGYYMGH